MLLSATLLSYWWVFIIWRRSVPSIKKFLSSFPLIYVVFNVSKLFQAGIEVAKLFLEEGETVSHLLFLFFYGLGADNAWTLAKLKFQILNFNIFLQCFGLIWGIVKFNQHPQIDLLIYTGNTYSWTRSSVPKYHCFWLCATYQGPCCCMFF